MFDHVVERHSVQVMEDGISQGPGAQQQSTVKPTPRRNHSFRIRDNTLKALEDDDPGSLVKATYREQISPLSPVRVEHVFDTVASFGESRAVSESLPTAHLEDRALTLRSRRSGPQEKEDRTTTEMSNPLTNKESTSAASLMEARNPRYLRVGALQKWNVTDVDREIETERERQREMVRKMEEEIQKQMEVHMAATAALEEEEEDSETVGLKPIEALREREREQEEVAAPKRPKMLDNEEHANKPRATYFALTGQIHETVHQGERVNEEEIFGRSRQALVRGEDTGMKEEPFDDFAVRTGQWGAQIPVAPFKRNPSLDAAMQKNVAEEIHIYDTQRTDHRLQDREQHLATREEMEKEKQRLAEFEKMKELERLRELKKRELENEKQREIEKRRQMEMQKEIERQKQLERQREQEREIQRELERQREIDRQKREKERQKQMEYERMKAAERELELQREFERKRQKDFEREKERMLDQERLRLREFEKQKEMERERERQMELERQREVERQKQRELEKQREIERQKELERHRELERQRELEKQREMEKERQRQLERQRELDRQRELERQRDLERQLEMERQREMERQKELARLKQADMEIERWKKQKAEERESRKELEELERIKELERQQLLDFELQRQRERQLQPEQRKHRAKGTKELEGERKQQAERQRGAERWVEVEQEKRTATSPLRPKVLDLDQVSLGAWTGRDENSPTARWKQPSLRPDEVYRPAILDIDSFKSQTQPDSFTVTGTVTPGRPQSTQLNLPQGQSPPQPQFHPQSQAFLHPSPAERIRTQLPPPLQPQILHQNQQNLQPLITERPKPHSLTETSDWALMSRQPSSALPQVQINVWGRTELAVDEPLWVSATEGSRRPISTRPASLEQQLLRPEERGLGTILTPNSATAMSPVFTPIQQTSLAAPLIPIHTPAPSVQSNLWPPATPILNPERSWTSVPLSGGSSGSLAPSPATPLVGKDTLVPASQNVTASVTDPKWSPNWELVSQEQRENRAPHRDKGQQVRKHALLHTNAILLIFLGMLFFSD